MSEFGCGFAWGMFFEVLILLCMGVTPSLVIVLALLAWALLVTLTNVMRRREDGED